MALVELAINRYAALATRLAKAAPCPGNAGKKTSNGTGRDSPSTVC